MFKLIKLEIKKFKLQRYIRTAIIANLIILACVLFINHTSKIDSKIAIKDYIEAFKLINTFVTITFVIFASVIISRLVIDEYRNKTITTLFMYPIDRRKLLVAKLSIVVVFTFIATIISNIFLGIGLYFSEGLLHCIPGKLTIDIMINSGINIVIHAFTSAFISLISLYFGMRKKSSVSTIVSAIIIVSVISSNGGSGVTLNSIIAVSLTLAGIGAFVSYICIRNIEHIDVNN